MCASLANQQVVFVEKQPIDVPILHQKDPATGALRIRYPFAAGLTGKTLWREVQITLDAQIALILILKDSILIDGEAGRTQPKSNRQQ